jgi:hypothetical protein
MLSLADVDLGVAIMFLTMVGMIVVTGAVSAHLTKR